MALSSYDTLAFDTGGLPCSGTFINSQNKAVLEIYKNWLYIHDKATWNDKTNFTKPVIAQVNEGNLMLAGFDIRARRGPQDGIFVYATTSRYFKQKNRSIEITRFAGIGCSGEIDKVEAILTKLGRASECESDGWCESSGTKLDKKGDPVMAPEGYTYNTHRIENLITGEEIIFWDEQLQGPYKYDYCWVGVKRETLAEFFKWLEGMADVGTEYPDKAMAAWIKSCKKCKAVRYNQGDAYFNRMAGLPLRASYVGKSKAPLITNMIKEVRKK